MPEARALDIEKMVTEDEIFGAYLTQNPRVARGTRTISEVTRQILTQTAPHTLRTKNPDKEAQKRIDALREETRIKISQMTGNEVWEQKRGTEKDPRQSPRSFIKTVQEILCDTQEHMHFEREELATPEQLNRAIQAMIIAPHRISNTLLENLGLSNHIPRKRASREERLAAYERAIPDIKNALMNVEPFLRNDGTDTATHDKMRTPHNFRLMRVTGGAHRGDFVGTQHIEGEKILFRTDLYGARRRLHRIEHQYDKEVECLGSIEQLLKDTHAALGKWGGITAEELNDLKKGILNAVDKLKNVRDGEKRHLHNQIEQCLTIKDTRGRLNPGMVRTRLATAIRHIARRKNAQMHIARYLGEDRMAMQQVIQEQIYPMQQFLNQVEQYADRLHILKIGDGLSQNEQAKITKNLTELREKTKTMDCAPFLMFGEKYAEILDALIEKLQNPETQQQTPTPNQNEQPKQPQLELALREPQPDERLILFIRIFAIAKIQRVYESLQGVLLHVATSGEDFHAGKTLQFIRNAHEKLKSSRIAPEIKTKELDQAFIKIYKLLNEIKKLCGEALADTTKTTKNAEAIKKAIKEFNWHEMLESV